MISSEVTGLMLNPVGHSTADARVPQLVPPQDRVKFILKKLREMERNLREISSPSLSRAKGELGGILGEMKDLTREKRALQPLEQLSLFDQTFSFLTTLDSLPTASLSPREAESLEKIREAAIAVQNTTLDGSHFHPEPARAREAPPPWALPNFGEVSTLITRGGEPTKEGGEWLVSRYHIKSEIDLRKEDHQLPLTGGWQKVKRFHIPIQDGEAPTLEQVKEFLTVVRDPENLPAYVHCWGGGGRTGALVACLRISQGWSEKEALQEARQFRWWAEGLTQQQKDLVHRFYQEWKKRGASMLYEFHAPPPG